VRRITHGGGVLDLRGSHSFAAPASPASCAPPWSGAWVARG
jgi:hypothetical protein